MFNVLNFFCKNKILNQINESDGNNGSCKKRVDGSICVNGSSLLIVDQLIPILL